MTDQVKPFDKPPENAPSKGVGDQHNEKLDLDADKLQSGPVMQRSCTDCICCLIFVAFVVGMAATAAYGFAKGDPKLLLTGWDADGNGCGYNTTTKDFPYLYWPAPNFNINTSSTNYQDYMAVFKYSACVRECPSGDNKTLVQCIQPKTFEASAPKKFANCEYYPAGTSYNYKFRYETKLVIGRYCLPSSEALADEAVKAFNDNFYNKYDVDKYSQYIGDLYKAWYVMAISVGVAVVAAMVYLIILRWFAGVLIWVSIVGILAALGGGGYWAYQTRLQYDIEDKNYKYLQYGAYALWGVTGAFAILVLLCCSRIRLAVAIMKVTSSFITNNPLVLLLPIIFLLLVLAWIIVWTFLAVFIMSVGEIKPRDAPFQFATTVVWSQQTRYIFLYHLFGGLWVNAFLIGCFQFLIAAACATWYFSYKGDTGGKGSICLGIKWILIYHLGSIAFGSFIIALVQFIRIIFEYYRQKIQAANKNNPVVKFMLCYTSYLLACLERCIKFITKNAYIQIALTSKNFCRSAWNAFLLILKNAFRFGAVNSVGGIFIFLGRLFIICLTVVIAYLQMTKWPKVVENTSSPYFPCIISGFIGYLIGAIFMSVFSFAADTILQCFLLDEELAESKGRPPGNRPPMMNDFIAKASGKSGCCG